jgi:hypothetical protein
MDSNTAYRIIHHVVQTTRPRWLQYNESWHDIDQIFIRRGYEQGGFQMFKFFPLLEERGISSINSLGTILEYTPHPNSIYNRGYAGSRDAQFYMELKKGQHGNAGVSMYDAVTTFLDHRIGNPGRFFWRMIWQLLVSSYDLKTKYYASFSKYLLDTYARFSRRQYISEEEFLSISTDEWELYKKEQKPWKKLYGIGENTFDFIVGDIVEATFAQNSYKFDSTNQFFLRVTGISDLIIPFDRDNTIRFLNCLKLPFTLREINKGIYTHCSRTGSVSLGYCRSLSHCKHCGVSDCCCQRI